LQSWHRGGCAPSRFFLPYFRSIRGRRDGALGSLGGPAGAQCWRATDRGEYTRPPLTSTRADSHGSYFINELCREISYVRDPCFVSRRTFSLADAQISHRCLGTEERCAAISHGSRCCPHDRAPAAFWTGEH
jgi:hypothetical protein